MSLVDDPGDKRGLLPRFTLKDADSFLLADALGDIHSSDDGFFTNDTRLLSRFELAIGRTRPSLLGAAIAQDNTVFTTHLTNHPLAATGELAIPKGMIHIERSRCIWHGRVYERIELTNFGERAADVPLSLIFAADFLDIFEVQGHVRKERGTYLPAVVSTSTVCLSYRGRDEIVRSTWFSFSIEPQTLTSTEAEFRFTVGIGGRQELYLEIGPERADLPGASRFRSASEQLAASMLERSAEGARIESSARLFNQWLDRSRSDLALLITSLGTGPYPYAGIPWFATQFGRDAIITALQTLWINPSIAAGVLRFLASTQATETSVFRDSEPGKIMHETRRGEMAALGEVPFGRYYGGVDTTPLFVMLAGAYEQRTGDRSVADSIWPALSSAMQWIRRRMEDSPTGFLDYKRSERGGLINQSWKDSHDSMFHADGSFPPHPVAVAEVQGYAFAALRAMSELTAARGMAQEHLEWDSHAEQLRSRIEEQFWIPEMNFYAIALDGSGKPCRVYASDAGHLLYCGVPSEKRAAIVTSQLLSERFAGGWGIRTLANDQPRFNPMSYHNGSIWPHDTSLCAAGIARYGERTRVALILEQIFETAIHFNMRLPELYCGFARIAGQSPVPYPVACLPQAWAAGSAFLLLQSCLGLTIDGRHATVSITRPVLPNGVESLSIRALSVGNADIDLEFRRVGTEVVVIPTRHMQADIKVLTQL